MQIISGQYYFIINWVHILISKLTVKPENSFFFFCLKVIIGTEDKKALNLAVQLSLPQCFYSRL